MSNLKVAQMNVQSSLIWELIFYKFELCYNSREATKNIFCAKGGGTADHRTVTGWFKKFHLGWRNVDDLARSGRRKSEDSEAVLQAIEANLVNSTQACHLTVQCGSSPSQTRQKHPELVNYASHYQNIAKTFHLLQYFIFFFGLVSLFNGIST